MTAAAWVCSFCDTEHDDWKNPCPACKRVNSVTKKQTELFALPPRKEELEVQKALEALRPVTLGACTETAVPRHRSWELFDECMGGGFPLGTTALCDGKNGLGKSTVATHVALCWNAPVLYVSCETGQGPVQVSNRFFRLAPGTRAEVHILRIDQAGLSSWEGFWELCDRFSLLIVDSLQGFTGNYADQLRLVRELGKWAERKNACALVLSRVNAKGETAGWEEVKHQVDACLSVGCPSDNPEKDTRRELSCSKNRNGELQSLLLEMTPKGLARAALPA